MTLIRRLSCFAFAALAFTAGTTHAAVYGKVVGNRVSVLYADTPPSDPAYHMFSRGNRFIVYPGALRKVPRHAQAEPAYAPAPSAYDSSIQAAATENDVDPALIRAVISVESGGNPAARSPKGAMGLMQLMPETARKYGVKNLRDPVENIHGGARYLRFLMGMFGNDLKLVLAAYNAGEEAVMKYGRRVPPFAETTAYVPKVLSHYKKALASN